MNNIYKISKGQLITLWVFGIIGWLISLDESDNGSGLATFFVWAIPFFLIFYSVKTIAGSIVVRRRNFFKKIFKRT